jgi:metal-responsive CopG/Arc/MetJ family transcriptional regulator
MSRNKELITFRLDPDLIDHLDEVARRIGTTRTDMLERCVKRGLEQVEQKVQAFDHPAWGWLFAWLTEHPERFEAFCRMVGISVRPGELKESQEENRHIVKTKKQGGKK